MGKVLGYGPFFHLGRRAGPGGVQIFTLSGPQDAISPCTMVDMELREGEALAVALGIIEDLKARGLYIASLKARVAPKPRGRKAVARE